MRLTSQEDVVRLLNVLANFKVSLLQVAEGLGGCVEIFHTVGKGRMQQRPREFVPACGDERSAIGQHELLCPAVSRRPQMHNRKLHRIANDQRLAKGAEGANPHKEEANTDRAGLQHLFGVDLVTRVACLQIRGLLMSYGSSRGTACGVGITMFG